nr:PREDICTED: uncharacterized protein LOC103981596 [Musa acuminata subsp. malaccensis]
MSGNDQQRVSSLDSTSSSSEVDELERVAPGTYCAWEPRKPKAPAQGRSLRRWRIRYLVKRRSQSDGKEKFVFLSAEQKRGCSPRNPRRDSAETDAVKEDDSGEDEGKKEAGKPRRRVEWDMVTGDQVSSGKGSRQAAKRGAGRPFLPYMQNVVGFFAIANGLGRFVFVFSLCFLFVCLFS